MAGGTVPLHSGFSRRVVRHHPSREIDHLEVIDIQPRLYRSEAVIGGGDFAPLGFKFPAGKPRTRVRSDEREDIVIRS